MSEQGALDFHRLHRTTDPETSVAAAKAAGAIIGRHEARILEALRSRPFSGATSQQLGILTGLGYYAVARRLRAMADRGLVIETDECRANFSGKQAIVWKAGIP